MSAGNTPENFVHNKTVTTAEGVRQTAVAAAAGSRSAIITAEIAFHRAVIASCFANNNSAGLQPSMQALRDLGGVSWK
jgi:hypothetical protein